MTTATIDRITKEIDAARGRNDLAEVARLRFRLPLDERNQLDARHGRLFVTSAGRVGTVRPGGQMSLRPSLATGSPVATSTSQRGTTGGQGWPSAVSMHWSVEQSLKNFEFDGRERAGWLIGDALQDDDEIEILSFVEGGDNDSSTSRSVSLDLDRMASVWENLPSSQTVVGELHVHPHDSTSEASPQDITGAAGLAQYLNKSHWISVVVCEHRRGIYSSIDLGVNVIRPDGNYRQLPITEARSF